MSTASSRPRVPLASLISAESLYDKCRALAHNLWWSWQPDVVSVFRDLDPIRWRQLDHNPVALLNEFSPERLDQRAAEIALYSRINQAHRRLTEYVTNPHTWGATHAGILGARPVAYFSAEFGIHESFPIYSGGLGVLSGDHIKSVSDLGVPLYAIGLFYRQGYFKQQLDYEGQQLEEYLPNKPDELPLAPALDAQGNQITVRLETRTGDIVCQVWRVQVGRVNLILLDSDVEGNVGQDRQLTSRLYGGDHRTRIRQELVLGVGGVRALAALGIEPGVFHLNEGHSAFAPLEAVRMRMEHDGQSFADGFRDVAQQTVFTTHTPVAAGHDRFSGELMEEHLGPLRDKLGISHDHLMSLGRVNTGDPNETFCMTVLALKASRHANGVSNLHGKISRQMWHGLWPSRVEEQVPIGHITNGVHVPTWVSSLMLNLYNRYFPHDWSVRMAEPEVWSGIYQLDPGELWETHQALKNQMLAFVRRRLSRQARRRGESDEQIDGYRNVLDPDILTIAFARRFATYKRATLLLDDLDRLDRIVNDPQRPLQMIFAGKAHPADNPGKAFIKRIASLRFDQRFAGKIVFIEDYDMNVARHLVQGGDVWLNNPRRPLEASGTSGQKAVLNGALNMSILDGWWAEAYDGQNGFAIGTGTRHVADDVTDRRDGASFYDVLEKQVVPLFYDRDADGLPHRWITRMKHSVGSLAWRFSAHRMVQDYVRYAYLPAAGGVSAEMNNM